MVLTARPPLQARAPVSPLCVALQREVERVGDVAVLAYQSQVGRSEPHRKECAFQCADDVADRLSRGNLAPARFERALLCFVSLLADRLKRLADVVDVEYSHSAALSM
ncbi:hypothetical protein AWB76_05581 [Caballeronia temeraria]|uniref:Uncharacterized protein n=1 Tax=Caballeronia temeraria TaxID=1777137 RepID=A0A158CI30_9BURK|nr:hypothetical protein AWB76_05581 [Caballeronia temeraria]